MAHQVTLTLSDQEYEALSTEAAKQGKQPEDFLWEIVVESLESSPRVKRPMTADEFEEMLYREGAIENIPTREPLTPEEQAERERLGQLFAGGKPMSEMVIEDRGPY